MNFQVLDSWFAFIRDSGCTVHRVMEDSCKKLDGSKSAPFLLGYALAGPIFGAYVSWLIDRLRQDDCKKIYCFARDGFLLLKLSDVLQSNEQQVDFAYLHGSRTAWMRPSLARMGAEEMRWICLTIKSNSIESIAQRIGMDCEELLTFLPVEFTADESLGPKQLSVVADVLRRTEVQKRIQSLAAEQEILIQRYLEEQGLLDNSRITVADLGWGGTMQRCLRKLLDKRQIDGELTGYYFGITDKRYKEDSPTSKAISFEHSCLKSNLFWKSAIFFEPLASALHGSTTGYTIQDEKVVPVLDSQGQAVSEWGYEDLIEGAVNFVAEHQTELRQYNQWAEYASLFSAFVKSKSLNLEFSQALGSYPFTPDSNGSRINVLAPALTLGQAFSFLFADPQARSEITIWPEGSAIRSNSTSVKILLRTRFLRVCKYLVKPWLCYEIMPKSWHNSLVRCLPSPIISLVRRVVFSVKT